MEKKVFWEDLIKQSKIKENELTISEKKQTGSYYTSFNLAHIMIQDLFNTMGSSCKEKLYNKIFLEPCGGTGNFIFCYLYEVSKLNFSKEQIQKLIDNLYYCEINPKAISFYKEKLMDFCMVFFDITLSEDYFCKHIGNALVFDITQINPVYIPLSQVFPSLGKVDIIITNPPYKNLKAESKHYVKKEDYERDCVIYSNVKRIAKEYFSYSNDGIINFYKLFVEDILESYTKEDALVSLLIPSSILSDKSCSTLRKHILNEYKVESIKVLPEGAKVVDATQELAAILINKKNKTDSINLWKDFFHLPETFISLKLDDIKSFSEDYNIQPLAQEDLEKLRILKRFPKVKDLSFIYNYRGELDLTLNKESIILEKSKYKLIRGRNLGLYSFESDNINEFVDKKFVDLCAKKNFIFLNRIACQQIVNKSKEKRVVFSYVPKDFVLANSCNFISLKEDAPFSLYFLLAVFNSSIINWYFKLGSSNNHINNYEINEFPIPINSPYIKEIEEMVLRYIDKKDASLIEKIDKLVMKSFFDNNETNNINLDLKEKIETSRKNKNLKYAHNIVLNHVSFKLSDLDLEMIKDVPQGGNWKNIPQNVVQKSKRLMQITKSGGRTTLYGRIDYSKPAYTITTYFNRPGNGTYVHPLFNRVITAREAARIQSFPDDYYFYGNKKQMLAQIGNAVPPLLAYQIAKKIISSTNCKTSVDLFCGAGGLTKGFADAGVKSLIANDIEESACITLACNNPEIPVLVGDITVNETKSQIINVAKEGGADIICGGPPCQGFSLAGFRSDTDPRNQLFRDFVKIVQDVNPKIVVFENVTGLLSYKNGETYKEILTLFSELGYNCLGKTLDASNFAVPQRRKRVIIICTRKDQTFSPDQLFPTPITDDESLKTTAFDAISDLENVTLDNDCTYLNVKTSKYVQLLKREIDFNTYFKTYVKNKKEVIEEPKLQFEFDF